MMGPPCAMRFNATEQGRELAQARPLTAGITIRRPIFRHWATYRVGWWLRYCTSVLPYVRRSRYFCREASNASASREEDEEGGRGARVKGREGKRKRAVLSLFLFCSVPVHTTWCGGYGVLVHALIHHHPTKVCMYI
jgi:hypothetical protein